MADNGGSPGLRMGRIFGIPVYISWTWFLIAAVIVYWFQGFVADQVAELAEPLTYAVALAFALLFYASVLLHELGHSVVARLFGLPVRRITLYLLGGLSEIEREPETPGREFLIALAGPLVSVLLGGLALVAALTLPVEPGAGAHALVLLSWALALSNMIVGVFNLLPGLPLDGGRLLRAVVWKIAGNPISGTVAAAWAGRGLAVLLVAFPILRSAFTGLPVDLIMMVWCAILGAFIWMGAGQTLRVAKVRARMPGLRARTLARRAVPVTTDVPLSEALRMAQESQAGALVVVDHDGNPVGLVSESAVGETPESRRPWITVGAQSRSIQPELVISADLEGEELVRAMSRQQAGEYLVVEGNGDVYGVLAAADVNRVLAGV